MSEYEGMTPLMMALDLDGAGPRPECIRTLLRLGADRSAQAGPAVPIQHMTAFEILTDNIDHFLHICLDDWSDDCLRIQVYASHQVHRKFPHTAAALFKSRLSKLVYIQAVARTDRRRGAQAQTTNTRAHMGTLMFKESWT